MAYCKFPDKHFAPILLLWGMKEGGHRHAKWRCPLFICSYFILVKLLCFKTVLCGKCALAFCGVLSRCGIIVAARRPYNILTFRHGAWRNEARGWGVSATPFSTVGIFRRLHSVVLFCLLASLMLHSETCSLRYLAFGFATLSCLKTMAFCGQLCMQAKQNSQSPSVFTPVEVSV